MRWRKPTEKECAYIDTLILAESNEYLAVYIFVIGILCAIIAFGLLRCSYTMLNFIIMNEGTVRTIAGWIWFALLIFLGLPVSIVLISRFITNNRVTALRRAISEHTYFVSDVTFCPSDGGLSSDDFVTVLGNGEVFEYRGDKKPFIGEGLVVKTGIYNHGDFCCCHV